MTAPEPGTQDLAEKVAAALHMGLDDACPNDLAEGEGGHRRWVRRVQEWADWIHEQYAPHLVSPTKTVVELPEPDGWVGVVAAAGEDTRTPYWKTSWGESVTAWIEGVETPVWELQEDLDAIRDDALKMLAAIATCERYRAEHQDGDPR